MVSERSDFLYKDVFDAIMAAIDVDVLQNDGELNLEISSCSKNMPSKYQASNVEFVMKFVYHRSLFIFQGSGNFIFSLSWIRFISRNQSKTGTTNF